MEKKEVMKSNETYGKKNKLLVVHLQSQLDSVHYWQVVILESLEIKNKNLKECHAVPYGAHPGVQWTLNKVRQEFCWRGPTVDVRFSQKIILYVRPKRVIILSQKVNYKILNS